ncbi:sensor domain-containing protein [Streptomyces rimosus]|uniref:sensor domain-containing protein n=1 Tax=Streptomyces rimosus TaxID=1927 RepID=UPI0037A7B0F8
MPIAVSAPRLRHRVLAPFTSRSLAAMLHAVLGLPFALLGMALVVGGLLVSTVLAWTALGPWLMALTVRGAAALGGAQRAMARGLLAVVIEAPARREGGGPLGWRRAVLGDKAGWRAVGCALLAPFTAVAPLLVVLVAYVYGLLFLAHPVLKHVNYFTERAPDGSERHVSLQVGGVEFDSWPRWLLVVATGAVLLLAAPWLLRQAQAPHRLLVRSLLGPDPSAQRIRTLEETRAHAVEDAAATLRRIERDLHDGARARTGTGCWPSWKPRRATRSRPWPTCGISYGASTRPYWTRAWTRRSPRSPPTAPCRSRSPSTRRPAATRHRPSNPSSTSAPPNCSPTR